MKFLSFIGKLFTHNVPLKLLAAVLAVAAVIACDQFTSDRDYWKRVERCVGDAPSTLHFSLPEVYLGEDDEARIAAIRESMYAALESDALSKLTRGAVFSYREFKEPLGVRLTDEEWQRRIEGEPRHGVPSWMDEVIITDPVPADNELMFYSSGC